MARRIRPITTLLKPLLETSFVLSLRNSQPRRSLAFPDWDVMTIKSRPLHLLCDVSTDGLGATLVQKQPVAPSASLSILDEPLSDNERNWTPMGLEAGHVVRIIRHLCRYLFSAFFLIYVNHGCLQQIRKIGERKPRIQRWMEFLSDCYYRLPYRRGRRNAYANSFPDYHSPLPRKTSRTHPLSDPGVVGAYVIRACDYISPPCPIPHVGLGGLAPSSYPTSRTGLDELFP